MSGEKFSEQKDTINQDAEQQRDLNEIANKRRIELEKRNAELDQQSVETNPDRNEAHRDAVEQAAAAEKQEKPRETREISPSPERHRGKPSKQAQKESYDNTMEEIHSQMPSTNRAFSKVIHNRVVEATSEAIGSTLARPTAVLTGSVTAFVIVLGVYLVARYYGYPLSGSETLIAFAAGWLIGIIFDFFRAMITGKR